MTTSTTLRTPRPTATTSASSTRSGARTRVLVPAVLVAGLLAGCSSQPSSSPDAATVEASASSTPAGSPSPSATDAFTRDADGKVTGLAYPGVEGKTALDLLLVADPSATIKGKGANAFVVAIGGRTADNGKHEFWELTVDGKEAKVGAGSLKTKDGETITWTLATY